MAMKKDLFIIELLSSFPVKALIILVLIIVMGVTISKCKEKKVQQMKEDVLYIQPKPKV
jgi:hypothetical protein